MRLGLATVIYLCFSTGTVLGDSRIEFNRDVRPILSDKCLACHGPDEKTREADLRLDLRESAIQDLGGTRAIVAGNAAKSELIHRVTSRDESLLMPPTEHGKPLSRTEIEVLQTWIDQGAPYQQHWSLTPLVKPDVPQAENGKKGHPIDAFIQRKLKETEFSPSPVADPRTLVRRLSFDLTGLPPDPSIVKEYSAGPDAAAYDRLVDRFLNSPHFGERMALYWLDLVRYADTLGYHGDQVRSVSPYRDYVIQAFNENKPFDKFTIEQLAGDLLPDATLWQKVASTYNRLNRASAEGGVQPKEYLAKYSADRVRTTGSVWLGSTLGCAECHDHKFDPFTTKDFYQFAAFFADIKELGIVRGANHIEQLPVPTEEQARKLKKLDAAIQQAEQEYSRETPELTAARHNWEKQVVADAKRWTLLKPEKLKSTGGAQLKVLKDGSILASGKNPDRDEYLLELENSTIPATGPVALKLELLPDPSLPNKGPGRAGNGNLVVNRVELMIARNKAEWQLAVATHSQKGFTPDNFLNESKKGWAILPQIGQWQQMILAGNFPKSEEEQGKTTENQAIQIRIVQRHGSGHNLGRFRILIASDIKVINSALASTDKVQQLFNIAPEKRSAEQEKQLEAAFRESTPLLSEVREHLERLRQQKKQLQNKIVTTLATTATEPRTIRVLPRGNWMDDSGDIVTPGVPHFLPQVGLPEKQRASRLDLAHWMTSRENPLVARTFVNRLWMLLFGQGLARSVDDLGSQGEMPTHPELLDWLASEFIDSGWDVKHMVRLMVTSEMYQQSSAFSDKLRERDPYNRLYARQSRWRLEAEMVRDNALQVSGLLNLEIGGASAKPYQPAGYWAQLNFPKRTYQHDQGDQQYRRGLYTHWQRTFLHPSLLAFDAPAREECTARRSRSNTPLQSLVLLNDPTFVEASRVLAARVIQETPQKEFETRLGWLMQQTLMRDPRPDEVALLKSLFEEDRQVYQKSPKEAEHILSVGLKQAETKQNDPVELAAWTSVTRAIMNLHETITRY